MPCLAPLRQHSRAHAFWAALVLAWAFLAPGLSVALAEARGDYSLFQDICRSNRSNNPQGELASDGVLMLLTQGHCPACHVHAQDLAPPPAPQVDGLMLRADLRHPFPERFWQAPVTAHAWRPASARAPPTAV